MGLSRPNLKVADVYNLKSKMVADKKTRSSEKEDELLLQDFSRRVSAKSSALFYGNAFIVSAIPIWLYWRIHAVDPASSAIILALVTIASTWLVAFAYRNTKHVIKHKVAVKSEAAEYEATTFSIFYNNAMFLAILIICSFYIFKTFTPVVNYVGAMSMAAGVVALLSTGSQ